MTSQGGGDSVQAFGQEGQKLGHRVNLRTGSEGRLAAHDREAIAGAVSGLGKGTASPALSSDQAVPAVMGTAAEPAACSPPSSRRMMLDDGRESMYRIFVGECRIPPSVFDECWKQSRWSEVDRVLGIPFIQLLEERGMMELNTSLRILRQNARISLIPLAQYKIDFRNAIRFPRPTCRGWFVLPFDTMGRYTLAATVNPFNQQAAAELELAVKTRVIWCLAHPSDLAQAILRIFH